MQISAYLEISRGCSFFDQSRSGPKLPASSFEWGQGGRPTQGWELCCGTKRRTTTWHVFTLRGRCEFCQRHARSQRPLDHRFGRPSPPYGLNRPSEVTARQVWANALHAMRSPLLTGSIGDEADIPGTASERRNLVGSCHRGAHNISDCNVESVVFYLTRWNAVIGGNIAP